VAIHKAPHKVVLNKHFKDQKLILKSIHFSQKSSKFNKKVYYCNTLNDLAQYIDLNDLKIPSQVKHYDYQLSQKKQTPSMYNIMSSTATEYGPFQQFKVPLEQ
jgi:hypothetical protein